MLRAVDQISAPEDEDMYKLYQQCRLNLHSEWETRQHRMQLKSELANWVHQVLNNVWDDKLWYGSQITFMFNYISGGFDRKCTVMEDEIDRIYSTLVPQVERYPRTSAGSKRVPILIAFPDYSTKRGFGWEDVTINDGLHYHGNILIHTESRLKVRLDTHIKDHYRHYVRSGDVVRRIYVQPIDEKTARRVTGYGFKALEWRIPDTDRVLILPKALSELSSKGRRVG
jgi:hypothetical protein